MCIKEEVCCKQPELMKLDAQSFALCLEKCYMESNVVIGAMFARLADMNECASGIIAAINRGDLDSFEVRMETRAGSFYPLIHIVYKKTSSKILLFVRDCLYSICDSDVKFDRILYECDPDRYILENQKNLLSASYAKTWREQDDSIHEPEVDELSEFISSFHIRQNTEAEE